MDVYDGEWKSGFRHGVGVRLRSDGGGGGGGGGGGWAARRGEWAYDDAVEEGEGGEPGWEPFADEGDVAARGREQLQSVSSPQSRGLMLHAVGA